MLNRPNYLLQRAVELAPGYSPALASLASILHSEGRPPEEVEAVFERALGVHRHTIERAGEGMRMLAGLFFC